MSRTGGELRLSARLVVGQRPNYLSSHNNEADTRPRGATAHCAAHTVGYYRPRVSH